jgi:hypothetical protein
MGLRLLRRRPAPAGRHARAVPGPLVPGAAAALVASADPWVEAPATESGADSTAPVTPVLPVAPVLLDVHQPVAAPGAAAPPPLAAEVPVVSSYAPVSLGFADGAQVDLPADDPRVRTFRAAAAALLESPRP